MKKFLSLILAALMVLSATAALAVPSKDSTDVTVSVPSISVDIAGATVTEGLFAGEDGAAATAAVDAILAKMIAAVSPADIFTADTQNTIVTALGVETYNLVLAAQPVALEVNDAVAANATEAQILTLTNVPVGEKFVAILTLTTGDAVEEVVLTEVSSDAATSEVYVVVDLETIAKIQAADTAVITVLTTVVAE